MDRLPSGRGAAEELLRELCGESYRLVVSKLPKSVQRELAETKNNGNAKENTE